MRLVIFGASGGCGQKLVEQALERGHRVTAVTRTTSSWRPSSDARHLVGDVLDPTFLREALAEQDVALSALGLRRASLLPGSRLLSPPDLVQRFTRLLRPELGGSAIRRVIWISAGGVGDSRARLSAPVRRLVRTANVGVAYADLEAAEEATRGDDRWLAVRPVTLVHGARTGRAGEVERYGLFSVIRRADVASWMLDVADGSRDWAGDRVLLGTV